MIKVTKEQKDLGLKMLCELDEYGTYAISNDLEHKIALELVRGGLAIITKKKNYGRIAEIKNVK